MQEIPYDVWLIIASHLSSDEIIRLLPINHALFDIAMDECYRTSSIAALHTKGTKRSFARLIEPSIAVRVRKLILVPSDLLKLLDTSKATRYEHELISAFSGMQIATKPGSLRSSSSAGSSTRMVISGPVIPAPDLSPSEAHRRFSTIIGNLRTLHELSLHMSGEDHVLIKQLESPSSFLTPGWLAFSATLRVLDLKIPLEVMEDVLPPFGKTVLTNLENLSMRIVIASLSTSVSPILVNTVLPFINAHRLSIISLSFDMLENDNISPLLAGIKHMSRLSSFSLKQPYQNQDCDSSGLYHFLSEHRRQLTSFTFCPMTPFGTNTPPIILSALAFRVPLPALQKLSISLCLYPGHWAYTRFYIGQFKSTLVSLKTSNQGFHPHEVAALIEVFGQSSPLRELDMLVIIFAPSLLACVAQNLPELNTLKLKFIDERVVNPAGYHNDDPTQLSRFAHEISQLSFKHWKLRRLNIGPLAIRHDERQKSKAALVNALPSVESFCDLNRDEYLNSTEIL